MKPEIRMPNSERNPKIETRNACQIQAIFAVSIRYSDFGLLSAFGIWYSDFQL
jgi:hypothetical protein